MAAARHKGVALSRAYARRKARSARRFHFVCPSLCTRLSIFCTVAVQGLELVSDGDNIFGLRVTWAAAFLLTVLFSSTCFNSCGLCTRGRSIKWPLFFD